MLRVLRRVRNPVSGLASTWVRQRGGLASAYVESEHADKKDVEVRSSPKKKYERHSVYTSETSEKLHYNVEELPQYLQKAFAKCFIEELKGKIATDGISSISFNNITENVYRYYLSRPIRQLGFTSSFLRYNHDTGLASFWKKEKQIADGFVGYKGFGRFQPRC